MSSAVSTSSPASRRSTRSARRCSALLGARATLGRLAPVLLGDRGGQAVEGGRLAAQQVLHLRAAQHGLAVRLLDHVATQQRVAGEVAAQDGIEADPHTGGETSLCEQLDGDRGLVAFGAPDRVKAELKRRGDRAPQALGIDGISDLARVGDRADPGQDVSFELGAAGLEARAQSRARPAAGLRHLGRGPRQSSTATPRRSPELPCAVSGTPPRSRGASCG